MMKLFIQKRVFIQYQLCMVLIGMFIFALPCTAFAKEDLRIWKPVHGVSSLEFAVRCVDAEPTKTCYWWFRNLSEVSVTLTYAMIGDGYTIKPTAVRVKGGRIVSKTEIVLPPNYQQPNFEGLSGQCIGADDIQTVAVIAYRFGDSNAKPVSTKGTVDRPAKPTTEQAKQLSAEIASMKSFEVRDSVESKSAIGFCRTGYEVLIDSCRCLPDAKRDPDKGKGKMTCRQKRVSSSSSDDIPELFDSKPMAKAVLPPIPTPDVQYGPPPPTKPSAKKIGCDRTITSCPTE